MLRTTLLALQAVGLIASLLQSLYPNSVGYHRCLGYALAMLELKLALATVLTNYQLKLADERAVKPKRRGLTIATSSGVPLVAVGNR